MESLKCVHKLMAVFVVFNFLGCGGGGSGGDDKPLDTTAPITTASPGGGMYGSIQYVTLSANEPATIYYSLDGTTPSAGGANTTSGTSPIKDIEINTVTLKFFAIDSAGNREAVKSESYTIDLDSPTISFMTPAPGPFGLLTSTTIGWQSDEAGDYTVELGGTGTAGTGLELGSGSVAAGTTVPQEISGVQLSLNGVTPLWIYVTDLYGHSGSSSLNLSMKALEVISIGGELWDIEMLPNGGKAYVSSASADTVAVIDTDPQSGTFHDVLSDISVGIRPIGIAITPDGSHVYVTNNGSTITDIDSISVISTDTDTVIVTSPLGSNTAPGGIAITPDGKRGYFTTFESKVMMIDTDPASLTYNLVVDSIIVPLLLYGKIGISPDGKIAVVNWQGMIAHAVDVIDVDPLSPTYNTSTDSIIPVISGYSGSIAFATDSDFVYMTSSYVGLCKVDLSTYDTVNSYSGGNAGGGIALTPDGLHLLHSDLNSANLLVFDASDLTLMGSLDLGATLGRDIAISPDGARAYVLRNSVSVASEVVMVPLH